jgi:hypothetical protein
VSSLFWQELMQDLPSDLRVIAVDLRGFGETHPRPGARRDVATTSTPRCRLRRWASRRPTSSAGRWARRGRRTTTIAVLMRPVSPYGFGGTRRDGSRVTADDAGCGAGGANPDFVQRLTDRDMTDEAPTSPRSVFRSGYVAPGYASAHEDIWVESMNTTSTATGNYPGDSVASENWPGSPPDAWAC